MYKRQALKSAGHFEITSAQSTIYVKPLEDVYKRQAPQVAYKETIRKEASVDEKYARRCV